MPVIATALALFSILVPAKQWFAPNQPITVTVKAEGQITLVLTEFTGKSIEAKGSPDVAGGKEVDIKSIFPTVSTPGTYILYAVPKGKEPTQFIGTPLVIEARDDRRPGQGGVLLVTHVAPLRYVVMTTDAGPMTMAMYYDVAPNTVDAFLRLSEEGYYTGLTIHRIVPDFVLQAGDPLGNGMGGPGYNLPAEFNDRKHEEGILSMARGGDPMERSGAMPRPEFANSAGSQFFICLSKKESLDNKYTVFGKVTDGMAAAHTLEKSPIADRNTGRPVEPPVIRKVEVKPVTAESNPYAKLFTVTVAK